MPPMVADPAVPAVFVLNGPCTPPPVPEDPPPPPSVNIDPAEDPDKVVLVPAAPVLGCPKFAVWLPPAPPLPIE